jgi:arsenate reductase
MACHVLFLCTGNSARSIIAEALLNHRGGGRFRAFSAGSHPRGTVHPMTLAVLERHHLPTAGLRSKSWDEFAAPASPKLDIVITVCGNAAREPCPYWPGHPMTAHWGIDDPAETTGSPEERSHAFNRALRELDARIGALVRLPIESLDKTALRENLRQLGGNPPTTDATG